jgi:hypothetical protein
MIVGIVIIYRMYFVALRVYAGHRDRRIYTSRLTGLNSNTVQFSTSRGQQAQDIMCVFQVSEGESKNTKIYRFGYPSM